MSNYFEEFPVVSYRFGNEETTTNFQHLGTYIDILDQVKEYNVYYQTYNIQNGERPDQLSYKLYRNTDYHWTFFLLNDHLRQGGWPIRDADVYPKAQEYYPNRVIAVNGVAMTQEPSIANGEIVWLPNTEQIPMAKSTAFVPGNYLYFPISKVAGKILKVDQKMGMITTDAEGIRKADVYCSAIPESEYNKVVADPDYIPVEQYAIMEVNKLYDEFDAPHHYEDVEGNWLYPVMHSTYPYPFNHEKLKGWDTDSRSFIELSGRASTVNSISNYTRIAEVNESQKTISVIKQDSIARIATEFSRLLRNSR